MDDFRSIIEDVKFYSIHKTFTEIDEMRECNI